MGMKLGRKALMWGYFCWISRPPKLVSFYGSVGSVGIWKRGGGEGGDGAYHEHVGGSGLAVCRQYYHWVTEVYVLDVEWMLWWAWFAEASSAEPEDSSGYDGSRSLSS